MTSKTKLSIRQQAENSTLSDGMQEIQASNNIQL